MSKSLIAVSTNLVTGFTSIINVFTWRIFMSTSSIIVTTNYKSTLLLSKFPLTLILNSSELPSLGHRELMSSSMQYLNCTSDKFIHTNFVAHVCVYCVAYMLKVYVIIFMAIYTWQVQALLILTNSIISVALIIYRPTCLIKL